MRPVFLFSYLLYAVTAFSLCASAKKFFMVEFNIPTPAYDYQGFSLPKISFASGQVSLGPNWLTILELAIEANLPLEA